MQQMLKLCLSEQFQSGKTALKFSLLNSKDLTVAA